MRFWESAHSGIRLLPWRNLASMICQFRKFRKPNFEQCLPKPDCQSSCLSLIAFVLLAWERLSLNYFQRRQWSWEKTAALLPMLFVRKLSEWPKYWLLTCRSVVSWMFCSSRKFWAAVLHFGKSPESDVQNHEKHNIVLLQQQMLAHMNLSPMLLTTVTPNKSAIIQVIALTHTSWESQLCSKVILVNRIEPTTNKHCIERVLCQRQCTQSSVVKVKTSPRKAKPW